MTTIAVMQPTFLPWLGYFALIHQADDFVFLDDVQFAKQSWQSRNQVAGPNGPVMLTFPVARKPSFPLIRDTLLATRPPVTDLLARIEGSLGRAPFWDVLSPLLERGFALAPNGLAAMNIGFIRELSSVLVLSTRFHRASDLGVPGGEKSNRLLAICQHLGADQYLSPVGSAAYLRMGHSFAEDGTRLRFLNFTHPEYPQRWKPFRPYMSVIDALAWTGPEQTRALILSGIGTPLRLENLPASQLA